MWSCSTCCNSRGATCCDDHPAQGLPALDVWPGGCSCVPDVKGPFDCLRQPRTLSFIISKGWHESIPLHRHPPDSNMQSSDSPEAPIRRAHTCLVPWLACTAMACCWHMSVASSCRPLVLSAALSSPTISLEMWCLAICIMYLCLGQSNSSSSDFPGSTGWCMASVLHICQHQAFTAMTAGVCICGR